MDWNRVSALSADGIQKFLLDGSAAALDGLAEDEQDRTLATLPPPLRTMWLINWLDFEIAQGSLLAYFYNSHGRHAELAADALVAIGRYAWPRSFGWQGTRLARAIRQRTRCWSG
jgi:hypothetical protein